MARLIEFDDRAGAAQALAGAVADTLRLAVALRGRGALIVSGGESPRGMLRALRAQPVPWQAITIVPSDERWVPTDDPQSNEGMIRRELLSGPAAAARFVGFRRAVADPADALPALTSDLAAVERPFDAVVLGVGTDGHTASLFPDSPDIESALRAESDVVVQQVPRLSDARISLTVRALLDARQIDLLFFGHDKRAVYRRALTPGPVTEYPLRAILRQEKVRVTAYWAP